MSDNEGVVISAAAVKLPLFKDFARDPDTWFRQADANFEISVVKESRTKAAYVLSCLDATHDSLIAHISLRDPDPYASMKEAFVAACGSDVRQRVGDLVAGQRMGAETPLHFLVHLERLAKDVSADDYLREFFLRGLPPRVSTLLRRSPPTTKLRELAESAKIHFSRDGMEIDADVPATAYVNATPMLQFSPPPLPADPSFTPSINAANRQFARGGTRPHPPGARGGCPNPPASFPPRPRQGGGDVLGADHGILCRLHRRWGSDAHNCTGLLCLMAGKAGAGGCQ